MSSSTKATFHVEFKTDPLTTTRQLYLGDEASQLGLSLGQPVSVTLTTQIESGSIDFGVDASEPTLDKAFSFQLNNLKVTAQAGIGANEVQRIAITGQPAGGTYTLTYAGQTTNPISYSANAGKVQAALEALGNISSGDVQCTTDASTGEILVEFKGSLSRTDVPLLVADSSGLIGGDNPTATITVTQDGLPADDSLLGRFLKLDVDSGSLKLNTGVTLSSEELTLGELLSTPLSDLVTPNGFVLV